MLRDLPDNERVGLEEVWQLAEGFSPNSLPDTKALGQVWARVEAEMDAVDEQRREPSPAARHAPDRSPSPRRSPRRMFRLQWYALAATIVIGGLALGLWLRPAVVTVPFGETASIQLKDGTTVELNSGSTLRYGRFFGNIRSVTLAGEAFFDVVRDEERPFHVHTFNARVNVLGTRFNVRAWENEFSARTVVALESGSVELMERGREADRLNLKPGQTARVEPGGVLMLPSDDEMVSSSYAWRTGDFFLSEEPVRAVLDEVERRFDTRIRLESAEMGEKIVKVSLNAPASEEQILEQLCASLGWQLRPVASGYEIVDPD